MFCKKIIEDEVISEVFILLKVSQKNSKHSQISIFGFLCFYKKIVIKSLKS